MDRAALSPAPLVTAQRAPARPADAGTRYELRPTNRPEKPRHLSGKRPVQETEHWFTAHKQIQVIGKRTY